MAAIFHNFIEAVPSPSLPSVPWPGGAAADAGASAAAEVAATAAAEAGASAAASAAAGTVGGAAAEVGTRALVRRASDGARAVVANYMQVKNYISHASCVQTSA